MIAANGNEKDLRHAEHDCSVRRHFIAPGSIPRGAVQDSLEERILRILTKARKKDHPHFEIRPRWAF